MPADALSITPGLAIPEAEIVERFVRASGAGGQNVNKVATAVELRFDIAGSSALPEALRERLAAFIAAGLAVPKRRIATRPTLASGRRRLQEKRGRGQVKRERRTRDWD